MKRQTAQRMVAIVGRPNVGKSTIFNRFVRERRNMVDDTPGVTRDRLFARVSRGDCDFFLCDTGGFEPHSGDNIKLSLVRQAELAIEEAALVLFVVSVKEGLHPVDQELMRLLRKSGKPVFVVVNKCDRQEDEFFSDEFRRLGTNQLFALSAEHGRGFGELEEAIVENLTGRTASLGALPDNIVRLGIVGRPNVGKSSILNALTGEERSIVDPRPGTTRDYVDVFINAHQRTFQVIDTAGIRRKSRVSDRFEKFSIIRSIGQIEECDVAILVIDASEGPTEGDARVAGYAFERRIPLIICVNKWDLIEDKTSKTADDYRKEVLDKLRYVSYAPVIFTSAKENLRVSRLLKLAADLYTQAEHRVSTAEVNRALKAALEKHTPPLTQNRARRIKFYYGTQVDTCPPRFVIFVSHEKDLHFSYKRYLENTFREAFGFTMLPLALHFRERTRKDLSDLHPVGAALRRSGPQSQSQVPSRSLDDDIRSLKLSAGGDLDEDVLDGLDS